MQMPMCSRCGKNVAVIFITKMDPNNKDGATQEGLCLKCARQLGIKPLDQMMEQMGLNDDTIDMLSSEINSLEDLGALMPAGPDVEDEDMSDEEAMADAASSVVEHFKGKIAFINVMKNLSVDCDCCAVAEDPCMKDIGILASLDPVAIDQACIDLVLASDDPGKEHFMERVNSRNGIHTIEAAADLGFGSREYELIQL